MNQIITYSGKLVIWQTLYIVKYRINAERQRQQVIQEHNEEEMVSQI